MPVGLIATFLNIFILTYILWPVIEHDVLIAWLAVILIVVSSRSALYLAYKKSDSKTDQTLLWYRYFKLTAVWVALCWGAVSVFLFPEDDIARQAFLAFVIAGMSAGAVSSLSYCRSTSLIFLLCLLVPLIIRFLLVGNEILLSMAIMVILFLIVLLSTSKNLYKSTLQNISLRIQSEDDKKAIEESESRFRVVVENASEAVFVHTLSGEIVDVNPQACENLGYTREELLSLSFQGIEVGEKKEDLKNVWLDLELGKSVLIDGVHKRKDGSTFPVEVSTGLIVLDNQKMILALARDVSLRKQAEEDLRMAKEEAELANQHKSEFLARMSHELRTPLNAILGFGQIILSKESNLDNEDRDSLEEIVKAGMHLLYLVDEVLDIVKIDAGEFNVLMKNISLAKVLNEACSIVSGMAAKNNIELCELPKKIPGVYADEMRLKQIVINLMTNAVKYNRPGGEVRIEVSHQEQDLVRVSVIDNGTGIKQDDIEILFEPFKRAITEDQSLIEGAGIGLSITKKLVEAMGGNMGVESEYGKGSVFWFELKQGESEEEWIENDEKTFIQSNEPPLLNGTILYIEDNPVNLKLVQMLIKSVPGLDMLSAENAETGIEIARRQVPDLIIMDINLPGMNGYEALQILRSDDITSAIPVIALSADAMTRQVEKGFAHFDNYLTKPFDLQMFLSTVKSVFKAT